MIAARFAVSLGWVEKLLRQRRRTGHIAALGHRGGAPRRLDEHAVAAVRSALQARPDMALEELRLRLRRQAKLKVCVSSLWRLIHTLDLPRKKRRSSLAKPTKKHAAPSVSRSPAWTRASGG